MAELDAPPLSEAVYFLLLMEPYPHYQRACVEFWRERYGQQFAESVRREAIKRMTKKKGNKK